MQVGMMLLCLGQARDASKEVNTSHEVLHCPFFADALAVVGHFPALQVLQLLLSFCRRISRHAPFAGNALFCDQLIGTLGGHQGLPLLNRKRSWASSSLRF